MREYVYLFYQSPPSLPYIPISYLYTCCWMGSNGHGSDSSFSSFPSSTPRSSIRLEEGEGTGEKICEKINDGTALSALRQKCAFQQKSRGLFNPHPPNLNLPPLVLIIIPTKKPILGGGGIRKGSRQ